MAYNLATSLWPNDNEHFFSKLELTPRMQQGPHCVSTAIAIITGATPEDIQGNMNTQNPVSWSEVIKNFGMKLAYCPFDVRKLKFYMDELIHLNDLFLLCYYSPTDNLILQDPNDDGWVCGSHVVVLLRDQIYDSKRGDVSFAKDHECIQHHTKRIFRVVPADHERGL